MVSAHENSPWRLSSNTLLDRKKIWGQRQFNEVRDAKYGSVLQVNFWKVGQILE
jgi:hypothetical protein